MPTYIHGLPDWPEFRWDNKVLAEPIAAVRHQQGRLVGRMEGLGFPQRSGPMQVVSGPLGRERVHYEAPNAARVAQEMKAFLTWFKGENGIDPVLKAALAHLWFVTIHPFDDGNGRIARAIADMQLARSEKSSHRFYSMSAQIREERKAYYDILEQTQYGTMDITPWMEWFLASLGRAFEGAE